MAISAGVTPSESDKVRHSTLASEKWAITWKRCKIGGKLLALTLRYFTKFGKPAFQLLTASSRIKLIDQKSASITHRTVKLVCVTEFTHSRVDTITRISCYRLTLLTFNLPSKFHFTTIPQCFAVWLPVVIINLDYNCALLCAIGESCIVFYSTYTKSS